MDRGQQQGGGRKGKEAMKGATQNALRLRSLTDLPPAPLHDCPHCGSSSTSFCYNNNYSLPQARYFCKSCLRIWTHGEKLRNIPVGCGVIIRQNNNRATGPSPSSSSNVAVAVTGPSAVAAAGPSGGGVRRYNKRSMRLSSSTSTSSSIAAAGGRPSAIAANVRGGVRQNNKRSRSPSAAAGPSNHQNLRVKNNNLPLVPNSTTRSSTTPTITEPPVPMTTSDPRPCPSKHPSSQVILGIGSTEFPLYTFERGRGFVTSRGEPFQSYNRPPPPPNPSGDFSASYCLSWLKIFGLSTVCPPPPPTPPPPQQQQQQYHYQYPPQVYRNMGTRGKAVINQPSQIPNMGTRGKAVINQPSRIPNMGRGKAVINQPTDVPMCIRGTVMPGTRGKTVIYHMLPLDLNMNPPSSPPISEQQAEWPPRSFNSNVSEQQAEWPPRSFNNNVSEQQAEWPPRSCNNNNTTSEAVGMRGRRRRSSSSSSSTAGSTTALSTTHPRNALNPTLPLNALNQTHPRESDDDLLVPNAECDHVVPSFHGPRTPTSSS